MNTLQGTGIDVSCDIATIKISWAYCESIMEAFDGKESTLNLPSLPGFMQQAFIQDIKKQQAPEGIQVNMSDILARLNIGHYTVITDNAPRPIKKLKKEGVIFIMSIDDIGRINIDSIDGRLNTFGQDTISRASFGRSMKPYALLYSTETS